MNKVIAVVSALLLLLPLALIALVQFYRATVLPTSSWGVKDRKGSLPKARAGPAPWDGTTADSATGGAPRTRVAEIERAGRAVPQQEQHSAPEPFNGNRSSASAAAAEGRTADNWPAPTQSSKRLLDGTVNWLPVPDAESETPSACGD